MNSSGQVTAVGNGTARIAATAADGSGAKGYLDVVVHKYTAADAKWIAHRGLHTTYKENTEQAFIAAGQAGGFWGCECDIWETKHETIKRESPQNASVETIAEITQETTLLEADEFMGTEDEFLQEESESVDEETYRDDSIENPQKEEETGNIIEEYEDTFDIVINHDSSFKRTMNLDRAVKDMTASEVRDRLPQVCFFGEYLDVCKQYKMVPVVEFKDPQMSDEAIQKAVDMMYERGLLKDACLISFYTDILEKVKDYASTKQGHDPYTAYLVGSENLNAVDHAKSKGYTCISVYNVSLTKELYKKCLSNGLKVGTWTYFGNAYNDNLLYLHTISGQYSLDFATVDYKPF